MDFLQRHPVAATTTRRYRRANLAAAAVALALLLAPRALRVTDGGDGLAIAGARLPELCLSKRLRGAECRSCHIGRSVVLASRGDLAGAAGHHRGGVLIVAWLAASVAVRALLALGRPSGARWWLDPAVTGGSLVALAIAIALA